VAALTDGRMKTVRAGGSDACRCSDGRRANARLGGSGADGHDADYTRLADNESATNGRT
jgi:hypothetical protein